MKIKGLGFIALCAFLILCLGFASGQFQKTAKTVVSNPAGKGYPAVSFNAQAELYLVVWQQRSGSGEDRDVMARVLDRDGSPTGDVVALASTGVDERFPKAASTNSSSWTVVWSTGLSIESCSVDTTGKAGDFRAITSGSRPVDRPEISSPSPDDAFLVVWEELDETGLNVIKGRRIHAFAGTDGEELLLGRSSDHDLRNPSIHQAGGVSFVAWEKHVSVRRVDIEGRLFPSGAESAEALGDIVPIAADGAQNSFPASRRSRHGRLPRRLAALGRPPRLRYRLRERDRPDRSVLREAHRHRGFPGNPALRFGHRGRRPGPRDLPDRPVRHPAEARDSRPHDRRGRHVGLGGDRP
jgi:hypothetical protein